MNFSKIKKIVYNTINNDAENGIFALKTTTIVNNSILIISTNKANF